MSDSFQVISPIDNTVYAERSYADTSAIDNALNKAQRAQMLWRQTALGERQAVCERMIARFVANREVLAEELCWQMGRPIRFAGGEIDGLAGRAKTMIRLAASALSPIRPPQSPGFKRWIQREPLGTVFVVAPWNYPYLTAVNTIIPAILAGNAVIFKTSAQTPICAERFCQALHEALLPDGVFQYLHLKHADTGKMMADSRIQYVAFTGSVKGGEMVEKAIAGRFKGSGLELGGKDPAYVRADADIDYAVASSMDGAFFNSGQSCCGIERIYVHRDVYTSFVEKAVAWVHQLKLGRPDDPETTLGPMVRTEAANFVRDQIAEAIARGAMAHIDPDRFAFDQPDSPWLAPQLLTRVDHSMRVMTQESFGPVIGIQVVDSDEAAVALMNDSEFGLTAAIYTRDYDTGIALGQRINTGTFFINRCDYLDPELAWTGVKNSGRGCTLSALGFESLTRPKSFHIKIDL